MQNQNRTTAQEKLPPLYTELIQELVNCALACEACAAACLSEEDVNLMTRCVELDRDCADTCFQTARLLMRDSEIAGQFLKVTEEICRLCAEECNKHDQEHCKICAELCERCAEICHNNYSKIAL